MSRAFSNFIWRFLERIGAKGVSFVVSIILARLLEPSVYGQIALISAFTNVLNVFVDSGMGNALIQKKNADDVDFSSVFFFNILMCSILYTIMFLAAPYIADFYDMPDLVPVIRVLSLTLVVSGVKNIQQAYISKKLLFKRFFFATLGGTIGSAVIGIWMAYHGFGIWSLVAQHLFNLIIDTCILWITVDWKPKFLFSLNRLKLLFSYAWKLLAANLMDHAYKELRQFFIGKLYMSEDLAFYNKGYSFPRMITVVTNNSLNSILFPIMSLEQDNLENLKKITRQTIKLSSYVMMPLMAGLAICADSIVRILLTDKWLPCVPYMRIFCFICAFWVIFTANHSVIRALGRSNLTLRIETIVMITDILLLGITVWYGPMAIAYGCLVSSIIEQLVVSWPCKKLIDYSYIQQFLDMLPNIVVTAIMSIIILLIRLFSFSDIFTLILQIILGGLVYYGLSRALKLDSYEYIIKTIKEFFHHFMQKN